MLTAAVALCSTQLQIRHLLRYGTERCQSQKRKETKGLQSADGSFSSTHPTGSQISLKSSPWFYDELELLVYYGGPHNLSAVVESRDPKAAPGECGGQN